MIMVVDGNKESRLACPAIAVYWPQNRAIQVVDFVRHLDILVCCHLGDRVRRSRVQGDGFTDRLVSCLPAIDLRGGCKDKLRVRPFIQSGVN